MRIQTVNRIGFSEFHLWRRCRRQFEKWYATHPAFSGEPGGVTHIGPGGERKEPPDDPIRTFARRESERVRSIGQYAFRRSIDAKGRRDATSEALTSQQTTLNAALPIGPVLVYVDVLRWVNRRETYRALLYRPATGIRGIYMDEAALILRAAEANELPLEAVDLFYLDKTYRRDSTLDRSLLFRQSDITGRGRKRFYQVDRELADLQEYLEGNAPIPDDYTCRQKCPLCVPRIPENRHSVFSLHKGAELARKLSDMGVRDVRDIPETVELSAKQTVQMKAITSGLPQIDCSYLDGFLKRIQSPVYFLDFEAYAPSVPPFSGIAPYEHTPVVVSAHRAAPDLKIEHHDVFVAQPGEDDRRRMFSWLLGFLGDRGSIVVFSAPFETAMIRQLAAVFGDAGLGESLIDRIVDLYVPFREFALYHPDQLGKASLKRVLPAFTGGGYEALAVNDGMQANLDFTRHADRATMRETGENATEPGAVGLDGIAAAAAVGAIPDERLSPAASLAEIGEYCAKDTAAMIELLEAVLQLSKERCG